MLGTALVSEAVDRLCVYFECGYEVHSEKTPGEHFARSRRRPQPRQAEPRITWQKFPLWKLGSLSANTSALTLPNVVSGLCLMP
jgi:hypothetical protein